MLAGSRNAIYIKKSSVKEFGYAAAMVLMLLVREMKTIIEEVRLRWTLHEDILTQHNSNIIDMDNQSTNIELHFR